MCVHRFKVWHNSNLYLTEFSVKSQLCMQQSGNTPLCCLKLATAFVQQHGLLTRLWMPSLDLISTYCLQHKVDKVWIFNEILSRLVIITASTAWVTKATT